MAISIITQLIAPSPLVIVGNGFAQWRKLKTKKVEIEVESSMADIPFATANLTTQFQISTSLKADLMSGKIIRPTRIRATMVCDDISTLFGIISVFNDDTHQLDITSKEIIADNMAITEMEFKQSPEKLSATDINITFEQTEPDVPSGFNPLQPGDPGSYGVRVNGTTGLLTSAAALYNKVLKFAGI